MLFFWKRTLHAHHVSFLSSARAMKLLCWLIASGLFLILIPSVWKQLKWKHPYEPNPITSVQILTKVNRVANDRNQIYVVLHGCFKKKVNVCSWTVCCEILCNSKRRKCTNMGVTNLQVWILPFLAFDRDVRHCFFSGGHFWSAWMLPKLNRVMARYSAPFNVYQKTQTSVESYD